ncbi:MAG: anaerobic ribonucleoside-triphosphate reductase activating protein [Kangiellaceae bacterium]|nr:anaerobic ribonucleoside-triphosphate reductase activating protein [Kangiellaceae bacterium]
MNEFKHNELRIGGLTPLTTIDYPDHLSCVLYCQGCSWRCRYCHNPELIDCKKESAISWQQALELLSKRKGLLDAVVFSGGEPLLQNSLEASMRTVKDMGFKIGLHTSGSVPKRFQQVLQLVDWVGFDIKGLPRMSDSFIQVEGASQKNWQSLDILLQSNTDYECRTTVHWDLINPQQLIALAEKLSSKGVHSYNVQIANNHKVLDESLADNLIEPEAALATKMQLQSMFKSFNWVA